jgi:alcohol dehydrogenase class IV
VGATDATLEEAAEKSMTKGRADNNPVPLDKETVLKILNNIKG